MLCLSGLLRSVAILPLLSVMLLAVVLPSAATAQPRPGKPEEGPAYTDPDQTDDDFPLQGEYLGWQQLSRWQRDSRRAGLQVIALGNGQFAATGYIGGLPGAGWPGGERQRFTGQRQGDVVTLTEIEPAGESWQLVVDGRIARYLSDDGRVVGEFHRVDRVSPTLGAQPPRGAIVLFDGSDTGLLVDAAVTADGLLQAGTVTANAYGDFRMHAEFRLPYKPLGRGQNRGNSGFYLQSRYEVQVLDTFGLEGVENECGALYKTRRPDVNMCYPPLVWQTYDIDLVSPRFDDQGNKVRDMRISVWHNGVPIHANVAIPHKTGAGRPEGPDPLPTKIQDHRNPVMFRNIWLIETSPSVARQGDAVASTAGRN